MANGSQTRWTTKKREAFLLVLADTANVTKAAQAINYSRSGIYIIRDRDDDFKEAWDSAMEEATDALEAEARRRALEGVQEPVYYQGVVVGHITKFSDVLTIFLLKGNRPGKYKERSEVTGAGGGPLTIRTEVVFVGDDDS